MEQSTTGTDIIIHTC